MGLYKSIAWDSTKELYVTSIQTPALPADVMPEAIITAMALQWHCLKCQRSISELAADLAAMPCYHPDTEPGDPELPNCLCHLIHDDGPTQKQPWQDT